jgi:glycyl-tRNA synthetase beta chain
MAEFFLELLSEEIPARLQRDAARDLVRLLDEALAPLRPRGWQSFFTPRRLAAAAELAPATEAAEEVIRGPRTEAPAAALEGFLRKNRAERADLVEENGYWVLRRRHPARPAALFLAAALPPLLWRFPWPRAMRWGAGSRFTWIRPLRRIVCLLDGRHVPFALAQGEDEAHGLASGVESLGHRIHAPEPFRVEGAAAWREELRRRFVLADPEERKACILAGLERCAAERGLTLVPDPALLEEVLGLVEWPVPLIGAIDPAFMDLPPEVRQVSMRVNQRYFTLSDASGQPAPFFAFLANIEAPDGGKAVVQGNERVLRARLADARHFWNLDRRIRLAERLPALQRIVFHDRLGSQFQRAERLSALARALAAAAEERAAREGRGPFPSFAAAAERAGLLCKADLASHMVGEFPELQGVMGYYYALGDGEGEEVAVAIRDHYLPKGPADGVPETGAGVAVALADKIDQITAFFLIGERPSGSGDPFALRRAALGVIRILRERGLHLPLRPFIRQTLHHLAAQGVKGEEAEERVEEAVLGFIVERLRVQLRDEGIRHDVLAAVCRRRPLDDDLLRLTDYARRLAALLGTPSGSDLLTAYRRAVNILRIEEKRDRQSHDGPPDPRLFCTEEEKGLDEALRHAAAELTAASGRPEAEIEVLASLRGPIDAFFEKVMVNAPEPDIRHNRLRLLSRIRQTMHRFAEFSEIEG